MTLSRTFPLIGGVLLTVLLAGCAGNAQTPANEDPATAKAGTDDGHGHATDSKEAKAEAAKAPADADEGVVPLTPEQIKASGIEVVAIGRGGGGSTRLSGRVEPSVGARASVASTVTGRVERVLVAPGTAVKQNQALAIVVSGEAAVFRANALAANATAVAARRA
ncbi:efflux RND transporter periplasmic adaptor subunit, partial [Stenotrophomonas maltophilia]|nr:efflux RND transporter periplasmic adaptor subunit [Stenotrophomonas maltophilia]